MRQVCQRRVAHEARPALPVALILWDSSRGNEAACSAAAAMFRAEARQLGTEMAEQDGGSLTGQLAACLAQMKADWLDGWLDHWLTFWLVM